MTRAATSAVTLAFSAQTSAHYASRQVNIKPTYTWSTFKPGQKLKEKAQLGQHDMDPIAADNLASYLSTWIERPPN